MRHETRIVIGERVALLADEVRRLRARCADPDSGLSHIADRIEGHVHALDGIVAPTAAELAAEFAPGQDDAVREAVRIVDARYASLRARMGRGNG